MVGRFHENVAAPGSANPHLLCMTCNDSNYAASARLPYNKLFPPAWRKSITNSAIYLNNCTINEYMLGIHCFFIRLLLLFCFFPMIFCADARGMGIIARRKRSDTSKTKENVPAGKRCAISEERPNGIDSPGSGWG
jgi:hypothetical protein